MKKILSIIILSFLCLSLSAQTPKYVFYMIGDGMGIGHAYVTDMYNRAVGAPQVNFYHFPVRGFVNTYSANRYATDSAAGGTALATGTKVNNNAVAWSVDGQPLESLAEKAQRSGLATGIVTNMAITDATPAAFYAKVPARNLSTQISRQLLSSKLDFAAGGYFHTYEDSSFTTDYWVGEFRKAGVEVYRGKGEYKRTRSRVLMLPSGNGITMTIDRREGQDQLSDFTESAIDYLYSKSKKGFFLMVEGGDIDHAAHANDAASIVHEVNDFCKSIDIVLNFCAEHPGECLIVVVADHETGGMGLAQAKTYQGVELLQYQKMSVGALTTRLASLQSSTEFVSWPEVRKVISDATGLWTNVPVTPEENRILTEMYKEAYLDGDIENVKNLYSENRKLAVEVIRYLDEKSGCRFTTPYHSSYPIGLYAYGTGASAFTGCVENTDVPAVIAKIARYR